MARTKRGTSSVVPFPSARMYKKVEFPTLERLLEEVTHTNIRIVRLDVFTESRPSELSFVYYTTLTLYVTAQDETSNVLYEFVEPLVTAATTEPKFDDEQAITSAQETMERAVAQVHRLGLQTLRGRYTLQAGVDLD